MQLPLSNFKEMLQRPGALDDLRACARVVGEQVTFDPTSPCYRRFTQAFFAFRQNPAASLNPPPKKEMDGPALWAVLHRRPYGSFKDPLSEIRWLMDEFTPEITCLVCQLHWNQRLRVTPPDFSSPDAYFIWTVEMHNEVNDLLHKPRITAHTARRIWFPPVEVTVKSDTVSHFPRLPTPEQQMEILVPVCGFCPSKAFRGFVNDGTHVQCDLKRGCKSCGGGEGKYIPIDLRAAGCPAGHWDKPLKAWSVFDRVVVISLKRRPDRLAGFWERFNRSDWPFKRPEVFEAFDGEKLPLPDRWPVGNGAAGCWASHSTVMAQAIQQDVYSILVFEDDAFFAPDFRSKVIDFIDRVPEWDCLMLGGQHLKPPLPVAPGIVRCLNTQRMHGYAVRGKFMSDLYQRWISVKTHTDWTMASTMPRYKVYAPDPFLIGQAAGHSDINGADLELRMWPV